MTPIDTSEDHLEPEAWDARVLTERIAERRAEVERLAAARDRLIAELCSRMSRRRVAAAVGLSEWQVGEALARQEGRGSTRTQRRRRAQQRRDAA